MLLRPLNIVMDNKLSSLRVNTVSGIRPTFKKWTLNSTKEAGIVGTCQCEVYRQAKGDLENKYLDFQEKCQKEYESKLELEIQNLRKNTTGELEKLMRVTNEGLQREIAMLRDSKLHVERSRDEALAKVRDLNIQNQELMLQ